MSQQQVIVLVPRGDGTFQCSHGVPTRPTAAGGVLSGMSRLIYLLEARVSDIIPLFNPTPGVNAVQTVTLGGGVNGGNFRLGYGGQFTPNLAWNATALTVAQALEQLSTVGQNNVTVTLAGTVYTVTFQNALGQQAIATNLATTGSSLSPAGATITVATTTTGAPSTSPITATNSVDGNGELSLVITDANNTPWTYRVIPAIELGTTKFAFLGRLVGGAPNAPSMHMAYPPTEYEWREATVRYQAPVGSPEAMMVHGLEIKRPDPEE